MPGEATFRFRSKSGKELVIRKLNALEMVNARALGAPNRMAYFGIAATICEIDGKTQDTEITPRKGLVLERRLQLLTESDLTLASQFYVREFGVGSEDLDADIVEDDATDPASMNPEFTIPTSGKRVVIHEMSALEAANARALGGQYRGDAFATAASVVEFDGVRQKRPTTDAKALEDLLASMDETELEYIAIRVAVVYGVSDADLKKGPTDFEQLPPSSSSPAGRRRGSTPKD
jgi:hypothetical protein